MILPDVNLLVYAYNVRAPQHARALDWWTKCLEGTDGVALAWAVIAGFVRITTSRRIFPNPLSVLEATERVGDWLALPQVQIVHPAQDHFHRWRNLLIHLGTAGNLTTDSHLAALAIERGLILYTTDADFSRFPGLKWKNPLS